MFPPIEFRKKCDSQAEKEKTETPFKVKYKLYIPCFFSTNYNVKELARDVTQLLKCVPRMHTAVGLTSSTTESRPGGAYSEV